MQHALLSLHYLAWSFHSVQWRALGYWLFMSANESHVVITLSCNNFSSCPTPGNSYIETASVLYSMMEFGLPLAYLCIVSIFLHACSFVFATNAELWDWVFGDNAVCIHGYPTQCAHLQWCASLATLAIKKKRAKLSGGRIPSKKSYLFFLFHVWYRHYLRKTILRVSFGVVLR